MNHKEINFVELGISFLI